MRCDGLAPFFLNSVYMAVPAVLISTMIGSLNGYVLSHWRLRGSEIVFTALTVGCFIPFQVVILPMARIDGAGFFMIYRRIIFPLSLPSFMVCFIWQFTQIWNDFLSGVVIGGSDAQPITVALNNLVNTSTGVKEYNVNMSAAIIAALPTLLIYLVAGKYFVRGLTAGAVKA